VIFDKISSSFFIKGAPFCDLLQISAYKNNLPEENQEKINNFKDGIDLIKGKK